MKQKVILVIALLALVLMMIAPVMADDWELPPVFMGYLSMGDSFPFQTADSICVAYGNTTPWEEYRVYTGNVQSVIGSGAFYYNTTDPYVIIPNYLVNGDYVFQGGVCSETNNIHVARYYILANVSVPVAGFACVPTSQYLNTDVVCTDTSTNTPTSWFWTIDYPALGITGWQTHTGQNFSWQSAYAGVFSVNLRATNSGGSDWENKTNYVEISSTPYVTVTPTPSPTIPAGYIRTEIITMDIYNNVITGTNINILDNEAAVWKNSTNDADGLSYIDTLPYHTLNVYGSYTQVANEYQDNTLIGISTGYDGGIRFWLILYPYNVGTGAGNTDLYVTVMGNPGLVPISNAQVRIDIPNNASLFGYTSGSGVQRFTVPNNTVLHVTGSKSGYQSQTTVMNSGSGTTAFANIVLDRLTVTSTPTSTVPPGGVTTPITLAPGKNPDGSYQAGYSTIRGQAMMNWLAENGMMLVQLCFLVTIFALLGVKLGK
jgi:PKD repeat protein